MLIKVKVFPDFGDEEVIKKSEGSFEVYVKEKPIRGLANEAVMRALSIYLNIPRVKIRLIKGFKERNKIFAVREN